MEKISKSQLIEKIQSLYETNEGDFKRKNTLYLNRFIEQQSSEELKLRLENMKQEWLYQRLAFKDSTENIESLRALLIEKIQKIPN